MCSPLSHLGEIVRSRIHSAFKYVGGKKEKKKIEYLGCDIEFYKDFLEKTFKPGMNWDNHGEWDIDHIIPLQYKQDSIKPTLEEVGKRLHYTNTQCLWHTENVKKGNRYCGDYQSDSESESISASG